MTNEIANEDVHRRSIMVLCAIVVAGAILRLYHIGYQGLWFDEAISVLIARNPIGDVADAVLQMDGNPPLYHYLLHAWFRLFGSGDLQARLFSATVGTLAIPFIFLLGARLVDDKAGLLSAMLLAVSQIGITYSQEVRPYALFLLLALCSSYLLIVALQGHNPFIFFGAVVAAVLMTYTHYFGVFNSAAMVLYVLATKKKHAIPFSWLIAGIFVAIVLLAPWLWIAWFEHDVARTTISTEKPPWFAVHWRTPASTIISFNNGRVDGLLNSSPMWANLLGGLLFTLPALLGLTSRKVNDSKNPLSWDSIFFLGLLLAGPLLCVFGVAVFLGVDFHIRYVAACIAPYYIFVSAGISGIRVAPQRSRLVILILLFSLYSLRANYFIRYKEDYRSAQQYVAEHRTLDDIHVFLPWDGMPAAWKVYEKNLSINYSTVDDVLSIGGDRRVWLIMYHRVETAKRTSENQQKRIESAYDKVDERRFFWVNIALYAKKK